MTPSEQAVTKTFRLSDRLSVEMTVGPAGFTCEWVPDLPPELNRRERRAYKKARDEMLRKLVEIVGGDVAVVDVDSDGRLLTPNLIGKHEHGGTLKRK